MNGTRKYLDRGRRVALEGRPYAVDWWDLVGLGLAKGRDGRADDAPFLSEVMWEGVSGLPRFPRPALLDHPFLRPALDRREEETMAYLTEQWSKAWVDPLRRDASEVRELLDRPDCLTAGVGAHYMTGYGASISEGLSTWYTGFCARCMRAVLLRIDPDDPEELWVKAWPFYDQEAEYAAGDAT